MKREEFERTKAKLNEIHDGLKELAIKNQDKPEGKKAMDGLDKLERWFLDFVDKFKPE